MNTSAAVTAYRVARQNIPFTKLHWNVANTVGIESALLVEIIQDWCDNNMVHQKRQYFHDDHWWTRGTYQEWEAKYPSLGSARTLQRLLLKLESDEYVIADQFNKGKDNTKFYRINEEKVGELYLQGLEQFRKSTMPNWHDETDVSNPPCQTVTTQDASLARSSIYKQINKTDHSPPLAPQGEKEGERNFGFEIRQESTPQSTATLLNQLKVTQPTSQTLMKADIAPTRVDPFLNRRRDPKDIEWDWLPDGPWRTEGGKLEPEFWTAIAKRWVKEHGGDIHEKKVNVLKHFKKDPANLVIEWEWYQSDTIHRAANIQTRKVNGLDTAADEQQILKHSAALKELPDEMRVTEFKAPCNLVEEVAGYATKYVGQSECLQQTPVLESVATVPDEIWDKVKTQSDEYETAATTAPEGAENHAAYAITVRPEFSDYYRKLHEKSSEALAKKSYAPITTSQEAIDRINALTGSKSMPSVSPEERQRFKEQEKQGRKLAYWNSLLQSGIPSAIADVERQARAQGYEIVDGQISEVEF